MCHCGRVNSLARNNNIIFMRSMKKKTRAVTSDFARTSGRPRRRLRRLRLRPRYEWYDDNDDRGGAQLHDCSNLRKYDSGTSSQTGR